MKQIFRFPQFFSSKTAVDNLGKNKKYYTLLIVILLVGVVDYFLAKRVFPITEGWWETYAWFIHDGLRPYVDFPLRYPPFYVYLQVLLTSIFGNQYLNLRIIAIFIHLFGVAILYFWLRKFVNSISAVAGVAIATGLVMSNPVYFAKDYHTIVAILVTLAFLMMPTFSSSSRRSPWNTLWNLLVSGLACGTLLITKQNIGIFFSFGVWLYWLAFLSIQVGYTLRLRITLICVFSVAYLMPAGILTAYTGWDWLTIFVSNDSKGSLLTVLFRFLVDSEMMVIQTMAAAVVLITYILGGNSQWVRRCFDKWGVFSRFDIAKWGWIFPVVVTLGIIYYRQSVLLVIALAWPLSRLCLQKYSSSAETRHQVLLAIPLYALVYCGTQTAGYNFVGSEMLVALASAEFFSFFWVSGRSLSWVRALVAVSLIFIFIVIPKVANDNGYNWWGLKSGGVLSKKSTALPFSELSGITSDQKTAQMFDSIHAVKRQLNSDDSVFAYPSIPIVYSLLGKHPVGAPVLWFDVSETVDGKRTVEALEKTRPKFIFWLRPPRGVYKGHFMMRKKDPAMLDVDLWLLEGINKRRYEIIKTIVSYDPMDEFSSIESSKHLEFYTQDCEKRDLQTIYRYCASVPNCKGPTFSSFSNQDNKLNITMSNGLFASEIIERSKLLVDADAFVFYVLKKR